MRIDRQKLKRSSSEVPLDCKILIEQLKAYNEDQLLETLKGIRAWSCGKCELYHWIDILDIFDSILEECCERSSENKWILAVDLPENAKKRELLLHVIGFTSLLIEHSFSRHLYSSIEHLVSLLASTDMKIVLQVLNLLFVFSKRSNFFSRISTEKRNTLLLRLKYLTQNWCSKENGFGLASCCKDLPFEMLPESATSLNFKYNLSVDPDKPSGALCAIHLSHVHSLPHTLPVLMKSLCDSHSMNEDQQMQLFTQLRLAKNFADYPSRLKCIQARLVALSIIVYCQSNANIGPNEEATNVVITNPIIEELVDVLELDNKDIIEIKSASLRTLTSITHHDRSSKMRFIIEKTGAASYHGFLPIMVRNCINSLIEDHSSVSISFATALFSFLYHLASYEAGCDALVQCGIMESLLKVIDWKEPESDHITFVTRAVRVIDLITNLDMTVFLNFNGLNIFLKRLDNEVDTCRKDQPFEIEVPADKINKLKVANEEEAMKSEGSSSAPMDSSPKSPMDVEIEGESSITIPAPVDKSLFSPEVTCFPQRAALLKSMLNFLKRAIQHSGISEALRNLLHGSFVPSMRHIVSNAEYYGPSLFMLTTDVISGYVFNEPSLLSTLQENGLTDVILYALLIKDVPPTKEVLSSLPNVFTALCLNHTGLEAFVALKPFDRLFKIFLSPDYLPAMRRRRNDNNGGDTATSLGNAMDELMRHQPSLRTEAISAIIKLVEAICKLGSDTKYTCSKSKSDDSIVALSNKPATAADPEPNQNVSNEISSEEEDDFFDTTSGVPVPASAVSIPPPPEDIDCSNSQPTSEETMVIAGSSKCKDETITNENKESIPLQEYIYNAMRFVDAILSNNSTEDHCREFLQKRGLVPLFKILRLPNLPPDFPSSSPCTSVASVFKSLLALTQDKTIFSECLKNFKEVVDQLDVLCSNSNFKGSALLDDLITLLGSKRNNSVFSPTLQAMSSIHAYIIVFIQICRTGQTEIRSITNEQWGSKIGLQIIEKLSKIYVTLVWESTLLLGLNDSVPPSLSEQIEALNSILKLTSPETGEQAMDVDIESTTEICPPADPRCASNQQAVSAKLSKKTQPKSSQLTKLIKPLLDIASRLGRSLAELFTLLVKLCVGSPIRRRSNHVQPKDNVPSKQSRDIAKYLNGLLQYGLSWKPPVDTNIPKYILTFYVCSIGFSTPMLLDDRKQPYHLMLQNFVFQGGHDSFFDCFDSIIGKCDYFKSDQKVTELSNGVIDFLDSWLLLLEKLSNPKNLLESAHSMPEKDSKPNSKFIPFDPHQFMIRTHRKAFACIKLLWNEKLFKINSDNIVPSVLQIISNLICGEAFLEKNCSKETNLQNFVSPREASSSARLDAHSLWPNYDQHIILLQEMGFTRDGATQALIENENDVERATEWLVTQQFNHQSLRNSTNNEVEMDTAPEENDNLLWSFADMPKAKIAELSQALTCEMPLEKGELSNFTETILVGIIELLDQLPETVHKCTSLLVLIAKRNGATWFEDMILDLVKDLDKFMTVHLNSLQNVLKQIPKQAGESPSVYPVDILKEALNSPTTQKLASRTYLLSLLFNQRKNGCALQINRINLLDNVVKTLQQSIVVLDNINKNEHNYPVPRWICHLIILLDVYEKYAICSKRRREALSNKYTRNWQYFEEKTQSWHSYSVERNKQIDQAFCNGEESFKYIDIRKKYTIYFNSMSLTFDDSGSFRPMMYVLQPQTTDTSGECSETNPEENLDVKPLSEEMSVSVIQMIVDAIKLSLDSETIHALIRLVLRLTRFHYNAVLFAELGGITTLLNLTKEANFLGVSVMASIMIRHVIEDEQMLKVSMDKFIRSQVNSQTKPIKEMHSLLRSLQAAACRDMEVFKESAKSILRININHKRFGDIGRNSDYLIGLPGKDTFKNINLPEVTKTIIQDLLNLLPVKRQEEIKLRQDKVKEECSHKSEPIFSTATIIFILSELVRSYNNIGKFISDFIYSNASGVQANTSILSFILENFLHSLDRNDQEIVCSAKSFYSALASVSGYPEIAGAIVSEIKTSIGRIAQLSESSEKHERISNIVQIVLLVVESSPEYAQINNPQNTTKSYQPYPLPILKTMVKKGMLADMTKLIQTLDFTSKETLVTVNHLLKTLEAISKLVNNSENLLSLSLRQNPGRRALRDALGNVRRILLPNQAEDVNMENDSNEQPQEEDLQEAHMNDEPIPEESTNPTNADVQLIEIRSRDIHGLNSDEVRTDDEEDEHEGNIEDVELVDEIDVAQRDNVGMIDLESSEDSSDEDTQSEDAEELVDEEEEEEDDDGGSTQDDHDPEEEDDPMGDEFEEANESQDIHEILSQDTDATITVRPQINIFDSDFTSYLVNFPSLGQEDFDVQLPVFPPGASHSGQFSPSFNAEVLIQHPFLTENSDSSSLPNVQSSNLGTNNNVSMNFHPLSRSAQRYRGAYYRPSRIPVSNIRGNGLRFDSIFPQDIFSRRNRVWRTGEELDLLIDNIQFGYPSRSFDPHVVFNYNAPSPVMSTNVGPGSRNVRWCEESRCLDSDYYFDALFLAKVELCKFLTELKQEEQKKKADKKGEEKGSQTDISRSQVNEQSEAPDYRGSRLAIRSVDFSPIPHIIDLHDQIVSHLQNPQQLTSQLNQLDQQQQSQEQESQAPEQPSIPELEDFIDVPFSDAPVDIEMSVAQNSDDSSVQEPVSTQESLPENNSVPQETEAMEQASPVLSRIDAETVQLVQPVVPGPDPVPSSSGTTTNPTYTMTDAEREILGDIEIPEGVDPSFLAALPENLRLEVIAEQLRLQRSTRPSPPTQEAAQQAFAEVSPEYLAALPPNLQEEVLAQQRQEQQRQQASTAAPDAPVDTAEFFQNLPPSLRRQILADLDDSEIPNLPQDIQTEARSLRTEIEQSRARVRSRTLRDLVNGPAVLSRLFGGVASSSRIPVLDMEWPTNIQGRRNDVRFLRIPRRDQQMFSLEKVMHYKGKFLLDSESISALLILLFANLPAGSDKRSKLQKLIRNLCCHQNTRQWIVQSLLDILEKAKDSAGRFPDEKDMQLSCQFSVTHPSAWLTLYVDSAFGTRTQIFYLTQKSSKKSQNTIFIHPSTVSYVVQNTLEAINYLSGLFSSHFVTNGSFSLIPNESNDKKLSNTPKTIDLESKNSINFFDVLLRQDSGLCKSRKSLKDTKLSTSFSNVGVETKMDGLPLISLISLFSQEFIYKNQLLTDLLLRALNNICVQINSEFIKTETGSTEAKMLRYADLEKVLAKDELIKLITDVIINNSCSENGFNDCKSMIVKLSGVFPLCRTIIYKYLFEGIQSLGLNVLNDINTLKEQLDEFLRKNSQQESSRHDGKSDKQTIQKGIVQDRYSSFSIIINSSYQNKGPSGKEVQLPSMSTLNNKSSSQYIFLQTLKMIINIRENERSRKSVKEKSQDSTNNMETEKEKDDSVSKMCTDVRLNHLWDCLSDCLCLLSVAQDERAVLVLQPAVEAFFLVHAPEKSDKNDIKYEPVTQQVAHIHENVAADGMQGTDNPDSDKNAIKNFPLETQKFLAFAEKHKIVLNQILRQSTVALSKGPFSVLTEHTRILDFDVKRKYFRQELDRVDHQTRRDDLAIHIRREHVFEDSFREINRKTPEEWKNRFYIVFQNEEGQDAGGLLREWYTIISREIFNPMYALFCTSPGDRVTYMINSSSHCNSNHLSYFKFVGRIIAKAVYDNKLLDCYFTRSFYKHILGKRVKYTDMEAEDYAFYQGLVFLLENSVCDFGTELSFSTEIQEFGVTEVRDLVPNGRNVLVTEENKYEYVRLVCQEKMTGSIKKQLNAFLEGFYEIIPKRLISIFNEHELELLISGLPNIDIDDLKKNTQYHKYQQTSLQIQWFWRALRSFDQAERAKFLQFVTGTSKVPLQGFASLEGMNGAQKFQIHLEERSTDRLPTAHTCFNQLDLPAYETYNKLRAMLLKAINECSEGFGFA